MGRNGIDLMAHLMRRAGFGASRSELERLSAMGYEDVVDQLLCPERQPELDKAEFYRYFPDAESPGNYFHVQIDWLHTMRNGSRPLQEKMALFWHHVFATGASKVNQGFVIADQVSLFRRQGMGSYRELLLEVARNPAMIFWLDNQENVKRAPNENWGRELLELFSMGVGGYTEKDVYEASRAFTGWSFRSKESSWRWGQFGWSFDYRPEEHDAKEKSFLGHRGRLNGADVIEIVLRQPACARSSRGICTASSWPTSAGAAMDDRASARSGGCRNAGRDSDHVGLRDEAVAAHAVQLGLLQEGQVPTRQEPRGGGGGYPQAHRRSGGYGYRLEGNTARATYMGQDLLNPPSVEGWHTGREWINSGALVRRVNFVADYVRDTERPGIQDIVRRITSDGTSITVEALVDRCLDLMGPVEVSEETHASLIRKCGGDGEVCWETEEDYAGVSRRIGELLALIAGTREYQFA